MYPVASASHGSVSRNSSSVSPPVVVSSPPPAAPSGNYLSTLSAERYGAIINDLGHNGLWNTEVMELTPFIALNLPGWEQVALRIEDEESRCVLFLPAMREQANMLIVMRQQQNQRGQLFYQPLVGQRFEEVTTGEYGDHFLAALYAANFDLLPGQLGSHEVGGFRQQLLYTLEHNQHCRDFIERHFYHWAPAAPVATPPYRGNNDDFEHYLSTIGFTIIARGEDVYRQLPQIREALVLFDNSLLYTLNHSAQNTSRLAGILARRLGIRPNQVTPAMLEKARTRLVSYHRLTQRYLQQDASQFLLSRPNSQRRGVSAQAFPCDSQNRIVFTTINHEAVFLEILQVVPHEISHMLPDDRESTNDYWYDFSYGTPEELRRTTAGIAAMVAEEEESGSLQGFTELILAKICDDLMMNTGSPAGMRRTQFLEMLERIRGAALDDDRWQQFLRYAQQYYPVSAEWLNTLRLEIYTNRVWSQLALVSGLNPTSPAGLLAGIHADKELLLQVILQNADSLVTLVISYDDQLSRQLDRQGHRFIRPNVSSDSFDTLSDTSMTSEPGYTALAHPETLTPYQLHCALEDLAQAATTLADTRQAEGADMLAVGRFLARTAARIATRLGYLTGQQSALPQISTTLFLTTLRKMLAEKLMTPRQILNIILPGCRYQGWSLCDAVVSHFWCGGKLLAWQQLVADCLSLLRWPVRHSYQDDFISSPCGRAFLQALANQLRDIAPYSDSYPEVINTLKMMIQGGLIPFSYQLAFDIRSLVPLSVDPTPPQAVMDVFSTLNYVREFRHIINEEQIQRLQLADMLAGLATQHRWFVVGENEDGEMQYFFDPQGNDISAQPPQLENNERVLVVRGNTLQLYLQTTEGPRDLGSSQWPSGDNLALIAGVQQLTGYPLTNPPMINQQFLRAISLNIPAQPATEAVVPAAAMSATSWLAGPNNTSQIHKHAEKIHRYLDKYLEEMTADNRFTHRGRKGPLYMIKTSVKELAARKISGAERADLNAIAGWIKKIEAQLQQISSSQGIDLRMEHFNTLPNVFHQMRQCSSGLRRSYRQNPRDKKNSAPCQREINKIEAQSEKGISLTLKTKGKIHSKSSKGGDGAPARYYARIRKYAAAEQRTMAENRAPSFPPASSADSFADMLNLAFDGAIEMISRTPFSAEFAQQCLQRDKETEQEKNRERAMRDARAQELMAQVQSQLENLSFEVQQWLAGRNEPRAGRRQHLVWLTDDHGVSEGASDATGSNAVAEQPAAEQQAAQCVSIAPAPVSEAGAVAVSSGVMINRGGGGTVTQLLPPGSLPQRPPQGRQWTAPVPAQPFNHLPHSGTNIRTMSELLSHEPAPEPQITEAILRISTRPPARPSSAPAPETPSPQQIRDLRLQFFGRGGFQAAPEPEINRQARIAETAAGQHRRMVMASSRVRLFDAQNNAKKNPQP